MTIVEYELMECWGDIYDPDQELRCAEGRLRTLGFDKDADAIVDAIDLRWERIKLDTGTINALNSELSKLKHRMLGLTITATIAVGVAIGLSIVVITETLFGA